MLDADTARVTLFWTGQAVPSGAATVFAVDNPGMATSLADIATAVETNMEGLINLLTTVVAVDSCLIKQGPDATGPSGIFSISMAGTSANAAVAPNTSVLLTKNTNQGGRAGRGRMYLPGVAESQVDNGGGINSTLVGLMQTQADFFVADMAAANLQLVLEHGTTTPFPLPGVVDSLTVQPKVATQRRRLRR